MKIPIDDIRDKMASILHAKGYKDEDVDFLIEMYLGGELSGHTSHGLASFPGFVAEDYSKLPQPEVLKSTAALFMIDAKANPGALVGKQAADEAIARAKKEGVGTAIIKNMDSWLRPGAIAQYIARQDCVALVTNSGGSVAIAPPGGYDPVTGTNPIAYGIPTALSPIVVDLATSKRAWGQVRLANKYGTNLPEDTFYNDQGETTVNPKEAYSVKAFGEYKGFSLALLVEILCGSLVGMNMMIENNEGDNFGAKMPVRGAIIVVFDPSQTTDIDSFKQANTSFLKKIKTSHTLPSEDIRLPGEYGANLYEQNLQEGTIDIPEEVWEEINNLG